MNVDTSTEWKDAVVGPTTGLQDVFGHLARWWGDRVLFTTDEPMEYTGYANELTGAQMAALGYKLARAMAGTVVAKPNARVIVAKRNHGDYFFYTHAVIRAGGVPVVVNAGTGWTFLEACQKVSAATAIVTDAATLLRDPRDPSLARFLASGATVWVTDKDFTGVREALPRGAKVEHLWPRVEAASTDVVAHRDFADDSPIALFHTSGTTGVPKLCLYDVRTTRESWKPPAAFPLTERSRRMTGLPCAHAVFFMAQTGAFLGGAWTYLPSKFEPKAWLSAMERLRITYYLGFPYTYMRMAAEDLGAYRLDAMMGWMSGGDTAHAAHIEKFKRFGTGGVKFGAVSIDAGSFFINPYGSTEIGGGAVYHFSVPGVVAQPCKVGKPASGVGGSWRVKIVDAAWNELPVGTIGRIVLKGDYAPQGYWNNDDLWVENRVDGWTWIGDVGRVDADGFVYFLDREVDSILTKAGTVYSLEAEEHLLAHEGVMEASVARRTLDRATGLGEAVAWIVPKGWLTRGATPTDWSALEAEVKAWANARLACPIAEVRALPLDEIPLGVTGKVLKRKVREALDASTGTHPPVLTPSPTTTARAAH